MDDITAVIKNENIAADIVEAQGITVQIDGGVQGLPGDSAYASAVKGGYAGTEADFYADLAAIDGLAAELEAIVG